jgi:diketogulonate reductase-like aldo/keto reductase
MATQMRRIALPLGDSIPVLGQGSLHLGEDEDRWDDEVAALQLGLDLGMTVIDTSETYGEGAAEDLVGDAIGGRRDDVFLVSQVRPAHFSHREMVVACEQSLRRLGTEWIDLYLLHSRGFELLDETLDALEELVRVEKISLWGVSHFGLHDLEELVQVREGVHVQVDQVPYNLSRRGIESGLLPWCRRLGIPLMACSPIEQGRLLTRPAVHNVAQRHGATAAQVALAWVIGHEGVMTIPQASSTEHVKENRGALDLELTRDDVSELDEAFAPPPGPQLELR